MFTAKRIKQIYIAWVLLMVLLTVCSIITGDYYEGMMAAVDKVPEQEWALSKSGMATAFSVISIIVFLIQALVGWGLLFFAVKQRAWAVVLFACFSIFMIYYIIDMTITLPTMYPDEYASTFDQLINWASCIISVVVFCWLTYGVVKLRFFFRSEEAT